MPKSIWTEFSEELTFLCFPRLIGLFGGIEKSKMIVRISAANPRSPFSIFPHKIDSNVSTGISLVDPSVDAILAPGCVPQVFIAIIESVPILMVYIESLSGRKNFLVHRYSGFSKPCMLTACSVEGLSCFAPVGRPLKLIEVFMPMGRNDGYLTSGESNVFDICIGWLSKLWTHMSTHVVNDKFPWFSSIYLSFFPTMAMAVSKRNVHKTSSVGGDKMPEEQSCRLRQIASLARWFNLILSQEIRVNYAA